MPEPTTTREWAVRSLKLPADQAIAAIRADAKIPEPDREHLIRHIERSGFAGVVVDAHQHFNQGQTNLTVTIAKLY